MDHRTQIITSRLIQFIELFTRGDYFAHCLDPLLLFAAATAGRDGEDGDRLRAAEARTDGERIGPAGEGGDRLEGVVGESAVGAGREGMGHDAGVKAGRDRRHPFWSGQIDQARPAAEGRHGRQSRGPCHPGRPAHDQHPAEVAFTRIPLSGGQSGELGRGGKRLTGWGRHREIGWEGPPERQKSSCRGRKAAAILLP
jgi:hypothetical protein